MQVLERRIVLQTLSVWYVDRLTREEPDVCFIQSVDSNERKQRTQLTLILIHQSLHQFHSSRHLR